MRAGSFHDDDASDRQAEQNDPVWALLAKAPVPRPDGWFTVRTLARCRYAGLAAESRGLFWGRAWRWVVGTGVGVCLGIFLIARTPSADSTVAPDQKNVQEAFTIMASLGTDSDSSSSSTSAPWQDSSL